MSQSEDNKALIEAVQQDGFGAVVSLREKELQYIRRQLEADPFLFLTTVCGFTDLVPRFHQPLAYLLGGRANRLAWVIDQPDRQSEVTRQIKRELTRFGIDWRNAKHLPLIEKFCRFINIRIFRGAYKSSVGVGVNTYRITVNPNTTGLIIHGVDDGAIAMCSQMGDIIKSDIYRAIWPDRIPENEKVNIAQDYIKLAGRTVPHKEPCIEARGQSSSSVGRHYDYFYLDDLIEEKMSPVEIAAAREFLNTIDPLSIKSKSTNVTRIHIGTRFDEEDDHAILENIPECVQIYVPIDVLPNREPRSIENIKIRGIPTLPEVHSVEDIESLKTKQLADPDKGAYSLLRNYYLVTKSASNEMFPAALVNSRHYDWKVDEKTGRRSIVRQARDRQGQPVFLDAEKTVPKLVEVDPAALRYALGVDPAVSTSETADEYGAACLAIDHEGVIYLMKTVAGKGWNRCLEAAHQLDHFYGYPAKIGWEQGGAQDLLTELMQRDERYRRMHSRIVPVNHKNNPKIERIDRLVASKLKMGDFLLDPADHEVRREMRAFRGLKNGKDARLDAIAIAMTCLTAPAVSQTAQEVQKNEAERNRRYKASLDPMTGTPLYEWAAEDGW